MIKKEKNPVSAALYGVAAIQGIVGVLAWHVYTPETATKVWTITITFAIFLCLGILARWARTPAAVAGVILYGLFLVLQAATSMELLLSGLIIKLPIVILLVASLVSALRPKPCVAQADAPAADEEPED
jgi:hypothetical protein